jgi:hypothetical protein
MTFPRHKYQNIRNVLGDLIGQRVVDITQQDDEEYWETKRLYVELHFENGRSVKFWMDPEVGFSVRPGQVVTGQE